MTRIELRPIDIKGLKTYKKMSPSKFEAKFGDLDLDNIPQEYMKTHKVQIAEDEWKDETYFDSIAYRKMILSGKPQTPVDPTLVPAPSAPVAVKAPEPDYSPADMGGGFKETATDVIPDGTKLDSAMGETRV